jgi:hypothetical protein
MDRIFVSILSGIFAVSIFTGCDSPVKDYTKAERLPVIFPDYTSVTIPPNIAPLNFIIREEGRKYQVEIYSDKGKKISIRQTSPEIRIPVKAWHKLLENNKGKALQIDIYTRKDQWNRYDGIINTIAPELVDNHLVYRTIGITQTYYNKLGIYQRNLQNFKVSPLFENTSVEHKTCMNCHSFCNNDPSKMSMHIRRFDGGTVIYNEGELRKFDTKTKYALSPATYTAWHPDGRLIAYSVNHIMVNHTSYVSKFVEVWDNASDLMLFDVNAGTVTTSPKIATAARENLPCWSPDGKWLYYISAPKSKDDTADFYFDKYSLVRIAFDDKSMAWGEADTVLPARETGLSITHPVVSPDGRYVLFCMIDHGYFSIFDRNSDLYLLDLQTGKYRRADTLNSPSADSWHAWSKNGRWVVFSSKRMDDVCSRPYFAYFDDRGNFHKPFVLPQEDPDFYRTDIWNFNLPVLVDGKVEIDRNRFRDFLAVSPEKVEFKGPPDALSGATPSH